MDKPLVSVITPCYNGALYLREFFDSILMQNYDNIEFFFVNDGSTDSTEEIACEYEKIFLERGIKYTHFKVTNRGQAAAINIALPLIKGDYLIWPDADDVLLPDNLSVKVEYLTINPEIDLVISQAQCIDSNSNILEGKINCRMHLTKPDNVFMDYIFERDVVFQPGVFMARVSTLRSVLHEMQIYGGCGGQNWQFILPIAYYDSCGYLDRVTYLYRVYSNSHSQNISSYSDMIRRAKEHETILNNVVSALKDIDKKNMDSILYEIRIKYLRRRFEISCWCSQRRAIISNLVALM